MLANTCSYGRWRERSLEKRMEEATSFAQWQSLADDLDAIRDEQSRNSSRRQPEVYDESLLREKVNELQALRETGQVEKLVFSLRADLFRDFGNCTSRCAAQPGVTAQLFCFTRLLRLPMWLQTARTCTLCLL